MPSKIKSQIIGYYTLFFYDINEENYKRLKRGAISKVIVTYPKQNSLVHCENIGIDVRFIQIEATGNKIYEHYGYQEIKHEIEEAIKKEIN